MTEKEKLSVETVDALTEKLIEAVKIASQLFIQNTELQEEIKILRAERG